MALRLDDHWLWDFWLADDGERHHLFHLQAPRSLGDPELRHFNATIGHATSEDLRTWSHHGTVIEPGEPGSWDDLAVWTGSVVRHDDRWHMLYTGCSHAEDGLVQRVGLATSPDLHHWTKHAGNPVLEADPRWYELLDTERWHDQAWRDPWIVRDRDGDRFHALVTARVPDVATDTAGVIGHAASSDLVTWEVLPPITGPSGTGQLEVPQVIALPDGHHLAFSYDPDQVAAHRTSPTAAGTWVAPMDGPLGPVRLDEQVRLGEPGTYSNKVVVDRAGRRVVLGFVSRPGTAFATLTDPTPLDLYIRDQRQPNGEADVQP